MLRSVRLLMRRDTIRDLRVPALEFGYLSRFSRPGDENAWRDLGGGRPLLGMTASHFLHRVMKADGFDPRALFFVTFGSRAVGVAYADRVASGGVVGALRFLAVKRSHRHKGLGKFLVSKVLQYIRDAGCSSCEVRLSPLQLSAIGLLLDLGFRPVLTRPTDGDRWRRVLRRLGRRVPLRLSMTCEQSPIPYRRGARRAPGVAQATGKSPHCT